MSFCLMILRSDALVKSRISCVLLLLLYLECLVILRGWCPDCDTLIVTPYLRHPNCMTPPPILRVSGHTQRLGALIATP